MTTAAFSTPLDHTSDAGFRNWGSEFHAKLAAIGLTQTADTGQINWITVTRPGTNSDGGYEIWRFNDTQQTSAPIYIKFFYGTGAVASYPRIKAQIGTASNGTGTVSGTGSSVTLEITGALAANASTTTNFPSYFCYAEGFLGIAWKLGGTNVGSTNLSYCMMVINRSADSSGTFTADGASVIYRASTSTSAYTFQYAAGAITSPTINYTLVHYSLTGTTVGADTQVFKTYMTLPRIRPCRDTLITVLAENPVGVTFSATTIGSTPHTYITVSDRTGVPGSNTALHGLAMLWE